MGMCKFKDLLGSDIVEFLNIHIAYFQGSYSSEVTNPLYWATYLCFKIQGNKRFMHDVQVRESFNV